MFVTRKKICRQTVLDSDADFYGMRLMLRAMTRYKRFTPMTYCGPELFLVLWRSSRVLEIYFSMIEFIIRISSPCRFATKAS